MTSKGLCEDKVNKIKLLKYLTGYSSSECKHYLILCDWNVTLAENKLKGGR